VNLRALNLRDRSPWQLWSILLLVSAAVTGAFVAIHLPAAMMLGPMISGIVLGANGAKLHIPNWLLTICFGIVSCLIARSIDPPLLRLVLAQWPVFLFGSLFTIIFGLALGVMMARLRVMPGTTAIWGSAPGAVMIMLVMAKEARADVQLVAVMQFLRVVIVAGLAALVALIFGRSSGGTGALLAVAAAPFSWWPFLATLALGTGAAFFGQRLPFPGASMLIPMFAAIALSNSGLLVITQPDWMLICAYVLFGWSVGLGFTRESLVHAGRLLPHIIGFILILTTMCAGLGYGMHLVLGTDMLTAFLATSPCGMDLIAVIAASTHVDMSLVMGMQVGRFLIISFVGPTCIAIIARWVERSLEGDPPMLLPPVSPDGEIDPESAEPFE
jgi:membrane AbrB-like protein